MFFLFWVLVFVTVSFHHLWDRVEHSKGPMPWPQSGNVKCKRLKYRIVFSHTLVNRKDMAYNNLCIFLGRCVKSQITLYNKVSHVESRSIYHQCWQWKLFNYRPQGKGNVFTGVCLSTIGLMAMAQPVRIILECFLVLLIFR